MRGRCPVRKSRALSLRPGRGLNIESGGNQKKWERLAWDLSGNATNQDLSTALISERDQTPSLEFFGFHQR